MMDTLTGPRLRPELERIYEGIYASELVYVPDCWKLCGDAHCCSFARYKSRFRMIARTPFQELPLLPGEFEFLQSRGWHEQFGEYEHRVQEFDTGSVVIRAESVISYRPGCACNHLTRPTICRLYPLLPVFDARGALCGTERMGIYEELESIGALPQACRLDVLPFDQLQPFLAITSLLSSSPLLRFYLEAYRITKRHVADRLRQRAAASAAADIFQVFEGSFLRTALVDSARLRVELDSLACAFAERHGPGFAE